MTRLKSLTVLAAPAFVAALAVAAPAPKEVKTTPITAQNAAQVRPVHEVPRTANRIVRGPNRGAVIVYDWKSTAEVLDDITLKPLRPILKDRKPSDVAVSRDGKTVAWIDRGQTAYTIQALDGTDKPVVIEIGEHAGYAAFSPDAELVAIGYTFWAPMAEGVGHSEVRLFDRKGKLVRTLDKTGPGAVHPVFSPDGKTLAVGNRNHETQLFEVATGKLLRKLDKRMIQEVSFSPDGKTLACGYVDGEIVLWDVGTGKLLHSAPSTCKEVYSLDWSPKGDVLATCGREGKIVLWDPTKLTPLKEFDAPFWVIQVRFTADGARLLTSSSNDYGGPNGRKVAVWSVEGGGEK